MNTVQVKNTVIGEGRPKICVPIVGRTKTDILEEAKKITTLPVDVVEWRVDWFDDVFQDRRLCSLNEIAENVKIVFRDGREEILYHRETENAMKYELEHFLKMLHGKESAVRHTQRSLNALELMDEMRKQCGISFPADIK